MRAWLEALEGKSLPSLKSAAPEDEAATELKGILKILMANETGFAKRRRFRHYQSTCRKWPLVRVWQEKHSGESFFQVILATASRLPADVRTLHCCWRHGPQ
jgi:hypothetical protein